MRISKPFKQERIYKPLFSGFKSVLIIFESELSAIIRLKALGMLNKFDKMPLFET